MTAAFAAIRHATYSIVAAATVVAVGAGMALGTALTARDTATAQEQPRPRIGLTSGIARLPLPPGWEPLGRRSSVPGMSAATAVRAVDAEVALDIRAPEDASLLPSAVRAAAGETPRPTVVRLSDRAAWRYELPTEAPEKRLVALTLPTTGGVVTIACEVPAGAAAGATLRLANAIRALDLHGARALAPAPETAVGIALPATIDALNARRRTWRRALAASRTPAGRDKAARRLADAYSAAAQRLRPLAAGEARRLTSALAALARDHRKLAAASLVRDAAAARRAGAAVEAGERELRPLLRTLSRPQSTARSAGYNAQNRALPSA